VSGPFWTDSAVREALGLGPNGSARSYDRVSTDTRSIQPGDLFVALKGDRFDAHAFLGAAAVAGATGAVISDLPTEALTGLTLYQVPDTLAALGQLGNYRRRHLNARIVGVVGSNGKTTTKELIRAVLSSRYRTYATQGNLNNQVGVPLTLLGVPNDAEMVVVEMGTDRPGEIGLLTAIVQPDLVAVTSIGEEHLELLIDLNGVLEEEVSVLQGLAPDGKAFVAAEPESLPRRAREIVGRNRVRVAGINENVDLRPDGGEGGIEVLHDGSTRWRWRGFDVRLPIPGAFNVRNALLALGVGTELGVPAEDAVRALGSVTLPKLRGEWLKFGDLQVLADCYNANPPSLAAAVDLLGSLPARGRRIAVLGTMRELGPTSDQLHAAAAERIAGMLGDTIDLVIGTGAFVRAFDRFRSKHPTEIVLAEDPVAAYEAVRPDLRPTDTILLKASRGDQLERWLPLLERDFKF
jgi:UDP-N-acetylmuramoyl-tripeptide--D-alanyl-D-alanine ligase